MGSSIRQPGLRTEQLEWSTVSPRPLLGLPVLQEQVHGHRRRQQTCVPAFVWAHPVSSPSPPHPSLSLVGFHKMRSAAGRGLCGHFTHCPRFHDSREIRAQALRAPCLLGRGQTALLTSGASGLRAPWQEGPPSLHTVEDARSTAKVTWLSQWWGRVRLHPDEPWWLGHL